MELGSYYLEFCSEALEIKIGFDVIWVTVERLTKFTHFLPINIMGSLDTFSRSYMKGIIRLHRVPLSIISDMDFRFTYDFLEEFTESYGYIA